LINSKRWQKANRAVSHGAEGLAVDGGGGGLMNMDGYFTEFSTSSFSPFLFHGFPTLVSYPRIYARYLHQNLWLSFFQGFLLSAMRGYY